VSGDGIVHEGVGCVDAGRADGSWETGLTAPVRRYVLWSVFLQLRKWQVTTSYTYPDQTPVRCLQPASQRLLLEAGVLGGPPRACHLRGQARSCIHVVMMKKCAAW